MASKRPRFDRIRITRVGFWYVLFTLVVGLAAANTGNNALYMVEAMLLALLAVSGFVSRRNLAAVSLEVEPPDEIYARQPFSLTVHLGNFDRFFAKRLLVLSPGEDGETQLVSTLGRGEKATLRLGMLLKARGRHHLEAFRVWSIFPLGLIFKSKKHPVELDLLVYPEIYPSEVSQVSASRRAGEQPSRHSGWGHELLTLREFRAGDDPRGIHWKQSARTGQMVYMEREAERGRRVSIVFDNAVGEPADSAAERRFERLVSEAASAAVHHLEHGYDVQLVTREEVVPFGRGRGHRLRLLETLALIEPCEQQTRALTGSNESSLEFRPATEQVAS
jgi:uncharacterized protein (DUF58 family)